MPSPRAASVAPLEIRLLGGFEVRRGDQPLEGFESKKVRALFAYLLLNRSQPLSRDRLAGLLWPEHSEDAARQNLRQAVYNLRSTLDANGFEALVATQQQLQLHPKMPLWLDVEAFEQAATTGMDGRAADAAAALREASLLYRGDLLAGFYVKETDLFEDWLAGERERLRETAAAATRALIVHHEARGEWDEGIRTARRLAQVDPLSEEAYRHLMRCFAFSGRRARALAQYEELKKLLDVELGVEPSAETVEFHRSILAQEAAPPEVTRGEMPPGPFVPLIGREAAVARLEKVWQEVRRGKARLTLVEGERGSGKTRLLRTFVHRAAVESDARVLQSRCRELCTFGLEPLLDALASVPAENQGKSAAKALTPSTMSAEDIARRLIAHTRSEGGKARPVLMLIDDLERAGRPTLEALADVLPLLRGKPVWILAAARHEEIDADHPLAAVLPRLDALAEVSRVRIERLDDTAPQRVAEAVVPEPAAARRIAKFLGPTAGLPLTLAEGVNLLSDEGTLVPSAAGEGMELRGERKTPLPQTLQEIVIRRVAILPTTSRRILTLAAVAGERFDSELLETADREHPAVIEAGLEILISRWLVRPVLDTWVSRRERDLVLWSGGARRGSFEFAQRAVRALIYHQIDPARRRNMHRRVAISLQHLERAERTTPPGVIGHHYVQAGDWPQAAPYLKAAGDAAAAAGDTDLAARLYARTLQALHHLDKMHTLELPELAALRREMESLLTGIAPRRARRR